MLKDFDKWNKVKQMLSKIDNDCKLNFKKRHIWWCSVGLNIGKEVYGKGPYFRRPVLIIKRLSKELSIVIPLSSKKQIGSWFYEFQMKNTSQYAMIHQIKIFHINRFDSHIGKISQIDFLNIQKKLKQLLEL